MEIVFEAGEMRHLPSDVARHIGNSMATEIFKKQDRRNPKSVKGMPEILDQILSPEIKTQEENRVFTLKEEIEQHEKEFAQYLENKKKEEILKRSNALEINL